MTPRRLAIGADAFNVAVVISAAIAAAQLSWRLAGDPGTPLAAAPAAVNVAPPLDLAPLIAFAPFGSTVTEAGEAAQSLELRGIVLAEPRSASTVLLAVGGAPVRAFAIGDGVSGATIDAIEIDHVLLRTAGGQQRLDYPNRTAGVAAPAVTVTATPTAAAAPLSGVEAIRALIPPAARGSAHPTPAPPVADPSRGFLDSIGAMPTSGGYRIGTSLSPAMQAAGLRPGDLIERVNGSKMGAADSDRGVLVAAMAAGTARVDVLRDGRRLSLSFPLR